MLHWLAKRRNEHRCSLAGSGVLFRTASPVTAMLRQEKLLSGVKRERWTEADVLALPTGEHDYFDRKSGSLIGDPDFRKGMAKIASALANSGGGHLVLGVKDDRSFDGVPLMYSAQTRTRDWLEQTIPRLLDYPLEDFRVHEVEPAMPSAIPSRRTLLVVDVGDSVLAPHQSAVTKTYYYRVAGRSEPAPHFYLETLRNRLTYPSLKPELVGVSVVTAYRHEAGVFVETKLQFRIMNVGRVAAYKWALVFDQLLSVASERMGDYKMAFREFPRGSRGRDSGIRIDDTILPGLWLSEDRDCGFLLRPASFDRSDVLAELETMLPREMGVGYRAVSEVSRGEARETKLRSVCDPAEWVEAIMASAAS